MVGTRKTDHERELSRLYPRPSWSAHLPSRGPVCRVERQAGSPADSLVVTEQPVMTPKERERAIRYVRQLGSLGLLNKNKTKISGVIYAVKILIASRRFPERVPPVHQTDR